MRTCIPHVVSRTSLLSYLLVSASLTLVANAGSAQAQVAMGNGFKIGEATQNSAVVWVRLTRHPDMLESDYSFLPIQRNDINAEIDPAVQLPEGVPLQQMAGSLEGAAGEVRVSYWLADASNQVQATGWTAVDVDRDFTTQIKLDELVPNTRYRIRVQGRRIGNEDVDVDLEGEFRTAPTVTESRDFNFVVVTCGDFNRRDNAENGHEIYRTMLEKIKPDFFVHTGDIEYYDKPNPYAVDASLARFKWNRLYALPYLRAFHMNVSSYFMKDDHDTVKNDCWEGARFGRLTWEQGLSIFREQFPHGERPYRTVRWGKALQVWLVEGRDFRSPNNMQDGPDKSIWGAEQKAWFFETVEASDATFKVLISPTPIVGPDRENKNDNHANRGFKHEGDELREFIGRQTDMFVICGDRHWQYYSVDQASGVHEFSCGPSSDRHAGGYREEKTPMHQYLKVAGGFLSVTISTADGGKIVFRHHATDGTVRNEYSREARSQ